MITLHFLLRDALKAKGYTQSRNNNIHKGNAKEQEREMEAEGERSRRGRVVQLSRQFEANSRGLSSRVNSKVGSRGAEAQAQAPKPSAYSVLVLVFDSVCRILYVTKKAMSWTEMM